MVIVEKSKGVFLLEVNKKELETIHEGVGHLDDRAKWYGTALSMCYDFLCFRNKREESLCEKE